MGCLMSENVPQTVVAVNDVALPVGAAGRGRDAVRYELLALVDAIRSGGDEVREIAAHELHARLNGSAARENRTAQAAALAAASKRGT